MIPAESLVRSRFIYVVSKASRDHSWLVLRVVGHFPSLSITFAGALTIIQAETKNFAGCNHAENF